MKNFKLILSAIALVMTSASFGYSAELTSTNTSLVAPPQGQTSGGTVVGINSNGTVVVVDHESGSIRIMTVAGLGVNISLGDRVSYIVVITPNGNEIIRQIGRN